MTSFQWRHRYCVTEKRRQTNITSVFAWLCFSTIAEEIRLQHVKADSGELEEARKKRLKHKIMIDTIYEIVSYVLYLILLTTAVNTVKDSQAFPFHRSLSDVFLTSGDLPFYEVRLIKQ